MNTGLQVTPALAFGPHPPSGGGGGGKESRRLEAKEEEKTNLEVLKLYVLSNLLNAKPLIGFCFN